MNWSGMACAAAAALVAAAPQCPALPVAEYSVGTWPESLGNHRARVRVPANATAVAVTIPWRRSDPAPQDRHIAVYESATGKQVANVAVMNSDRESGTIVFQPNDPGEYYIYYLLYEEPEAKPDLDWVKAQAGSGSGWVSADLIDIQARSEFDRLDPMAVIATAGETNELLKKYPLKTFLLFPEDRRYPSRMTDFLPKRWIDRGPSGEFTGEAQRNEYYVFQVGVYAARQAIKDIAVTANELRTPSGATIPASAFRCINLGGVDWLGRPISKEFAVDLGKLRTLWFGVQIPKDAEPGVYEGTLMLQPPGAQSARLKLAISVKPEVLEDQGDGELWRMSRLRWLDSTIGLDEQVIAPYTPVVAMGNTVKCLGREVRFSKTGLPESITSNGREILARPMEMVVETSGGALTWSPGKTRAIKASPGSVLKEASAKGGAITLRCASKMEFDGYVAFQVRLKAEKETQVKDMRLEIPIRRDVATYMMGMSRKGGYRPKEWKWAWDIKRCDNAVWIGDVDAGLQCKLKGPNDTWEIYDLKASGIPKSWSNDGKGGCAITEQGEEVVVRAYSGDRKLAAGEEIEFRFSLLVTPVKPLDPNHWNERYYHAYVAPEKAKEVGATIINIHHGNELNPYINYPFIEADKLSAYISDAHEKGLKVKIYYTVRELTNYVTEMWALRSLGSEVFADGPGGGYPWLQEHLGSHYSPAWVQPLGNGVSDAAIATTGLSRWHNYYLEGLSWLLAKVKMDGLYLDGIGYDREIMKRVRKVMDGARPGSLIDFHSGNEFPFMDLRISPANKYMEHFPYVNSLWFGEGYDYDEAPDYWLVEVSGIPFGLFGEMLQGGGNPWRGMLYGMTGRYYQNAEPRHVWKVWDDFGIRDAKMTGYWSKTCPVKTERHDVVATVYAKAGKALVAIASWAKEPADCALKVDWSALGLDPAKAVLTAPAVPGFQDAASFAPSDEIPLQPGKGWLLILEEK